MITQPTAQIYHKVECLYLKWGRYKITQCQSNKEKYTQFILWLYLRTKLDAALNVSLTDKLTAGSEPEVILLRPTPKE